MRKLLSTLIVLFYTVCCFPQYHIGYTTTTVNLRECAGTNCDVICKMPLHSTVFVFSDQHENGFYKVIFIDKDIEGYVSDKYVKLMQKISVNEKGTLQRTGESDNFWPTISIENACKHKTTLRMNNKTYHLEPYQKREIISDPGQVLIIASSPGIIPYVGADVLENNAEYRWKFYVVRSESNASTDNSNTAYVSSTDGQYYHKKNDCISINKNGNIRRTTVKQASKNNLSPCPSCYDIEQ